MISVLFFHFLWFPMLSIRFFMLVCSSNVFLRFPMVPNNLSRYIMFRMFCICFCVFLHWFRCPWGMVDTNYNRCARWFCPCGWFLKCSQFRLIFCSFQQLPMISDALPTNPYASLQCPMIPWVQSLTISMISDAFVCFTICVFVFLHRFRVPWGMVDMNSSRCARWFCSCCTVCNVSVYFLCFHGIRLLFIISYDFWCFSYESLCFSLQFLLIFLRCLLFLRFRMCSCFPTVGGFDRDNLCWSGLLFYSLQLHSCRVLRAYSIACSIPIEICNRILYPPHVSHQILNFE